MVAEVFETANRVEGEQRAGGLRIRVGAVDALFAALAGLAVSGGRGERGAVAGAVGVVAGEVDVSGGRQVLVGPGIGDPAEGGVQAGAVVQVREVGESARSGTSPTA